MKRSLRELQRRQSASLGYLLIRCAQLWNTRAMAKVNAEAGAPVFREVHTRLLPYLQRPGGVRVGELGKKLDVTKQAAQQVVAEMKALGLVRLTRDPSDARARRVELTDFGVTASLHGTGVLEDIERTVTPRLGRRDARALRGLLGRLLRELETEDTE